jgi:hypothetical protein
MAELVKENAAKKGEDEHDPGDGGTDAPALQPVTEPDPGDEEKKGHVYGNADSADFADSQRPSHLYVTSAQIYR